MQTVSLALEYFHPWPNSAGFYLARELGGYERAGIDLELRTVDPGRGDTLAYLARGEVDLGIFPSNRLLVRREQGDDLVAIAAINQRGLETVRTRTDSGIDRPRDLEGRRIALNPTPRGRAIVRDFVAGDGGNPDRVELVDVGARELDPADGFGGLADATFGSYWAWDNLLTTWPAERERVWQVDTTLGLRYHGYLLGGRRDWVEAHPGQVAELLAVTGAGYAAAAADQDAAAAAFGRAAPYFGSDVVRRSIAAVSSTWFHEGRWGVVRDDLLAGYADWLAGHGILADPSRWPAAVATGAGDPVRA
jgi:putative hydroxymethylpyrimidine transport system substrate-binding protein